MNPRFYTELADKLSEARTSHMAHLRNVRAWLRAGLSGTSEADVRYWERTIAKLYRDIARYRRLARERGEV